MPKKIIDRLPWGELDNFIYMAAAIAILSLVGWDKESAFLVLGAIIMKMKAGNSTKSKE